MYSHFFVTAVDKKAVYHYASERTDLSGKSETLIADTFWPVLSPDGSRLSYVSADLASPSNDLYISDPDGKNALALTTPGSTPPVNSHLFSPDGKTIYFSMVNPQTPPAASWFDKLFGIKTPLPTTYHPTGIRCRRRGESRAHNQCQQLWPVWSRIARRPAPGIYQRQRALHGQHGWDRPGAVVECRVSGQRQSPVAAVK